MEYILNFVIIAIEILCLKNFIEIFAEKNKKQYVCVLSIITLTLGIYGIDCVLNDFVIAKIMCVVLCMSFWVKFINNMKLWRAVFMSASFMCILTLLDAIILTFFGNIFEAGAGMAENDVVGIYYKTLLTRMIMIALIMYIKRKFAVGGSEYLINEFEWLKYLYFPLMTIIIIVGMLVYCDDITLHNNVVLSIVSLLAVMNFIVFSLIENVVRREKQISESKLLQNDIKSKHEYYQYVSENYEIQRQEIHEFKNQIDCILEMLNHGEYAQTQTFLKNITENLDDRIDCIDTKNAIINAVLNQKYRTALKKEILMVFQLQNLSENQIKDTDIVTILSNLIDNAIETCEKCNGQKRIKVKIKFNDAKDTIISVKNSVPNGYKFDKNHIVTNKKNKRIHGCGIKNIINIVEKNEGHYNIECSDNEFFFSIIIPQIHSLTS